MTTLHFNNGEQQALGSIFCIGRNYVAHIEELGNTRPPMPLIFTKPATALGGTDIHLPAISDDIHYETELVVMIGKGGKNIAKTDAAHHIGGWAVGLDLTARDIQSTLTQNGMPWELAKGFDGAARVSAFADADAYTLDNPIEFSLTLNGEARQHGNTHFMIYSIAEQIAFISQYFTLRRGDILFTGTPQGVGKLHVGDQLTTRLGDIQTHYTVKAHEPN